MHSAPAEIEAPAAGSGQAERPYRRRSGADRSQAIRSFVQFSFIALNLWIGVQFYHFVRQYEAGSTAVITRPPGVEGWLPIAGLMNTRYLFLTGNVPAIHPAAMFLLIAFLAASILFRKAFCSWLCPVGTLSEYLWKLGRDTFKRNFRLPKWLDIGLRSLKYVLFGLFAYAVVSMPAQAIAEFLGSPYGVVADVKMLNFFRYMGTAAAVTLAVLVIASIFVQNFWCRYLCPYGALMGLAALLSPLRIRRKVETCIDCAKCAKACPSRLPVDQLVQIRSAECLGCLECVAVCPVEDTLHMTFVPARKPVHAWIMAAGVAVVFLGVVGYAQASGHWHSAIPEWMYREFIPRVNEYAHPR
ncbi:MAG: 4Fe-4S binding protein [Acidobacteria bacterium]|nr:4Fe-4S binding protein [Acidobacteriota bacterium]